jgi:hypothetical protein
LTMATTDRSPSSVVQASVRNPGMPPPWPTTVVPQRTFLPAQAQAVVRALSVAEAAARPAHLAEPRRVEQLRPAPQDVGEVPCRDALHDQPEDDVVGVGVGALVVRREDGVLAGRQTEKLVGRPARAPREARGVDVVVQPAAVGQQP